MKAIYLLLLVSVTASASDWNSSPNNWENSEHNWENSSSNWKNSPHNWENNPNRYGNNNIIRGNDGNASGYAVKRSDGGVNIFDNNGNRIGYMPGE